MPPIESYEIVDGQHVAVPHPGSAPPSNGQALDEVSANGTGTPGAPVASPAGEPPPPESSPAQTPSPSPGEGEGDQDDDDTPLRDDSEVNAERLNRRFARLTRLRRAAERQVAQERQQHQVELAQTRGQLEAVQRLLSGAAPALPETPAPPAGPPQAEQFASHEDYVLAAARYGAQQELQARDQQAAQERQQAQQAAFQQQLMEREATFRQAHPDFDQVVTTGLGTTVGPILKQALMLVPDGPAVAYALATQPDLVQRLNTLPPPLVLVELGRLSPPTPTPPPPGLPGTATNGSAPSGGAQLPAPLTPLSGSSAGAPTGQYREDMTQQEYAAWRKRTSQLPTWKER